MPLQHAIRHTHPRFANRVKKQFPEYGTFCRDLVLDRLNWLDGVLQNQSFIAGDTYTIADITLFPWLDFSKVIQLEPFAGRDRLKHWYKVVSSRPSTKA